jgi:hypothetical protein
MMCSPRSGETGTTVRFSDSPRKAEKPSCHPHRKHCEPSVQKDAPAPPENGTYTDGQVGLLSPIDLSYHALNRIGAAAWELLATPATQEDLVDSLTRRFTVTPEQCRTDLDPFLLTRMTAIGVLTVCPARGSLPGA